MKKRVGAMALLVMGVLMLMTIYGDPGAHAEQPAAEPAPDDFAYGMSIRLEGEAPIYEMAMPEAVYRQVTRPDLGDMRVFNGENEAVPHAVARPERPVSQNPPVPVPFFPLPENLAANGKNISLNITTDPAGTIIDVETDGREARVKKISAWLLDLSGIEDPPEKIEINWNRQSENFSATVAVYGSNDLNDWRLSVPAASIAQLDFSGHQLFKNEIDLPAARFKYLKLTWPQEAAGHALTDATIFFPEKVQENSRNWISISGKQTEKDNRAWTFDSGGVFPVDRIDLALPGKNNLLQALIQARRSPEEVWHDRCGGLFYRLSMDETLLVNDPVRLSAVTDRYWRIKIVSDDSGPGGEPPRLKLGWTPHRLIFLARGNPPFTLAFGSAGIGPAAQTVDLLFSKIYKDGKPELIKSASAGEMSALGGPDRLKPIPPPLPWKKWLLWVILVSSVAALAWMALKLYRQMNAISSC